MIVRKIDLKHHVDENGQIVKSSNNTVIAETEPLILFRARDRLALPLLQHYKQLCIEDNCNDYQLSQIDELIGRFERFAEANPDVMKQPGVTRGL